ncbi:MAG: MlaD family protein [Melioribacteraceae bacterium]
MLKHLEGAKLGLFVFIGTGLIVLSIFLVGNKDSLFSKNIMVKTYFDNIEGLRSGASVRLNGLTVGSVSNVELKNSTTNRVEVTMRIKEEVIQYVRLDSEASIETEGMIGSKLVSISPGTASYDVVKDNGVIMAKDPVNMSQIISETQDIMKYMKDLTKEFSQTLAQINSGEGTMGRIINDDELYFATVKIVQSADTSLKVMVNKLDRMTNFIVDLGSGVGDIVKNVDSAAIDFRNLIGKVENGEGALGALISDKSAYDSMQVVIANLTKTTAAAREGGEAFAENMEALKHNWLFKKYFEQRGYWKKSEYERNLETKVENLYRQQEELDKKILELKELEEK